MRLHIACTGSADGCGGICAERRRQIGEAQFGGAVPRAVTAHLYGIVHKMTGKTYIDAPPHCLHWER